MKVVGALGAALVCGAAWAGGPPQPTLLLAGAPQHCYQPGDMVQIQLRLKNVTPSTPVAGFQAFTNFNNAQLQFQSASYTSAPFGLPILTPIAVVSGNQIKLAAGINTFTSQPPATSDAVLVNLNFLVLVAHSNPMMHFMPHVPPTNMTTPTGAPVATGQVATELTPTLGDLNSDGHVDGLDIGILLSNWSIPVGSPGCGGNPSCPSDLNCDGVVDGLDIGVLLANWTG